MSRCPKGLGLLGFASPERKRRSGSAAPLIFLGPFTWCPLPSDGRGHGRDRGRDRPSRVRCAIGGRLRPTTGDYAPSTIHVSPSTRAVRERLADCPSRTCERLCAARDPLGESAFGNHPRWRLARRQGTAIPRMRWPREWPYRGRNLLSGVPFFSPSAWTCNLARVP